MKTYVNTNSFRAICSNISFFLMILYSFSFYFFYLTIVAFKLATYMTLVYNNNIIF